MKNPLKDIAQLFFPKVCAICGRTLPEGGDFLCNYCRWEIPLTRFWEKADNPVAKKFYGHLPVVNASSFFYFVHDSGFRDLVHKFKYRGAWQAAEELGRWFGEELRGSPLYEAIDVIIPIPLHIRKKLRRGYNQSEYIARGLSDAMGLPVDTRSVARTTHNRSQTRRHKSERWANVEGIFSVGNKGRLQGKHILLVDDVLTTGATIISCGEAILYAVPDCRLSIAVLAVSKSELESAKTK